MEHIRVEYVGESSSVPQYASSHAAGADLKAALPEPITVSPGSTVLVPTGLRVAIPEGYEGQVRPRSGLALKHGITVLNAPGTIDSDYRGEVKVLLINLGPEPVTIRPQDRIAQIVFAPVVKAEFVPVRELPASVRGAGGFGSTG
ncbi:MAG: dUTP diphosphatase [Spirochaetales bacterium]